MAFALKNHFFYFPLLKKEVRKTMGQTTNDDIYQLSAFDNGLKMIILPLSTFKTRLQN